MQVRVLHIEDSPQDAWLVERGLRDDGWTPEVRVVDSLEALSEQLSQRWDVVLADFGLPGLSTLEALRFVRERQPGLPFVVVSGQIGEENAVTMMKAGADDYVSKNFPQRLGPVLKRILTERRHQTLEAQFREFFQNNLAGMALLTPEGEIREINHALVTLLGLDRGRLPSFWSLVATPDAGAVRDQLELQGSFGPETMALTHVDGKRVDLLSTFHVPGEEGLIWANFIDRTEQRALQEQVFQVRKLESLGQLAGGIAHEFNNILAVCRGHLALLDEEVGANESAHRRIEVLQRATARGTTTVQQLLMLARRRPLQQDWVDPAALLEETRRLVAGVLPENLTVKVDAPPDLPVLWGDRDQLGQALLNLVINARDVLPQGGTVVLAARIVHQPEGNWLRLEVRDDGPGVPEELRSRIFDPFFTTKAEGKGTGLGLSLVAGVAQGHRGWAGVEPATPRGSVFFFLLPLTPAPLPPRPVAPAPRPRAQRTGNLYLVENETDLGDFEAAFLTAAGYQVIRFTSGDAAWNHLSRQQPDLVVTDLGLAGLSGEALCTLLLSLPNPPALVVQSGNLEPAVQERLERIGIHDFLYKPFSGEELLESVDRAMERKGPP